MVELWRMDFENCFPPIVAEELVFHVKRGCVTCWGGVFMGSWAVSFFLVLW